MTITTIEDGGIPPDILEEVKVYLRRSTGNQNPTLSEDQLRRLEHVLVRGTKDRPMPRLSEDKLRELIKAFAPDKEDLPEYDPDWIPASDPDWDETDDPDFPEYDPDWLNSDEWIDEITVRARDLSQLVDWSSRWLVRTLVGSSTYYLGMTQEHRDRIMQVIISEENKMTVEVIDDTDELMEELETGHLEIIENPHEYVDAVYAPYKQGDKLEEVMVYGKIIPKGAQVQYAFPLEWITPYPAKKVTPLPFPDMKPTPNSIPVMPSVLPTKDYTPGHAKGIEEADDLPPARTKEIDGHLQLDVTPQAITLTSVITPTGTKNKTEENTLRRDTKSHKNAYMYRKLLLFVNRTYGEFTELQDLWQVIVSNIYVDGKPLSSYKNQKKALSEGEITIDWEQMAIDYWAMELTDRLIGKGSKLARSGLNEMNYWGPNPDVGP